MKKFVVLSDLHAHTWSAFSKGDGLANTRLRYSLNILEASLQRAQKEDIPWLFAGDLVHTAGYALNTVMAGIVQVLNAYPTVPKVAVWGNHDARGVGGKITVDQTVFGALVAARTPLTILDPSVLPAVNTNNGLSLSGAGYQPRADLLEFGLPSDVGLYHQTVRGTFTPSGHTLDEGIDARELLKRHRLSIVGHVHHAQQVPAPEEGQGILIPGSPEHHNFGDHGDHGWWVVTLLDKGEHSPGCAWCEGDAGGPCVCDEGGIELEFVPGNSPEFRTVDTAADLVGRDDKHFYRVRSMAAGTTLPAGVQAVAPTPTTVTTRDALRGVAEAEQVLQVWLKMQEPPEGQAPAYLAAGRSLLVEQDPTRLRDVTLTQLRLKNFCSYEEVQLDVERGLWLITGKGRDYPSNGAGKSSLVGESLYWLLFGRTTKGLGADEVVRWGEKECSVRAVLKLSGDNGQLEVMRERSPQGHTLNVCEHWYIGGTPDSDGPEWDEVVWEATSVNEMTAKLGRFLGITPEIFQNLAYFSQEKLLLFSSATDGERKNVLADLIGLSAYQQASEAAAELGREELAKKLHYETFAQVLYDQLEVAYTMEEEHAARIAEWERDHVSSVARSTADVDEVKQKVVVVDDAWAMHEALKYQAADKVNVRTAELLGEMDARVAAVRAEMEQVHAAKFAERERHVSGVVATSFEGYASRVAALEAVGTLEEKRKELEQDSKGWTVLQEALQEKKVELSAANTERHYCQAAVDAVAREGAEIEKALAAGVCPTCSQAITDEHRESCLAPFQQQFAARCEAVQQVKTKVDLCTTAYAQVEQDYAEATQRINARRIVIAKLEDMAKRCAEATELEQQLETLREVTVPEALVREKVQAQVDAEIAVYTKTEGVEVEKARQHAEKMADAHARFVEQAEATLARVLLERNPHIAAQESAVANTMKMQKDLEEASAQVTAAVLEIAMYDYWRTGFSKQGLQSLLVEEIATLFNAARADIFPLLTQGVYDVQFSTLSHTKSGELREKTEFVVYEHGEPVPYGALSGGQRRRVDIGIMLVLVLAVSKWMGVHGVLGLLVLDEVFGFLDASGAEGLLAALGQVTEQVRTTYVVTHDTHLQSMLPEVICVEQDSEGVSHVCS